MMFETFSQELYEKELAELFVRFPSVQNVPFSDAYKPGLERMCAFNELLGCPDSRFKVIHVAGTNGKGSTSNMLASALSAHGYRTGLFTSPHIEDFRERMRVAGPGTQGTAAAQVSDMVPKEYALDFILRWKSDFERLSLSFFEITTGMAFRWFADMGCDYAVIEVGLGGRLDSTNIVDPELSVITSIGLDHCDLLGHTLGEIAAEKAGIIKAGRPVIIGEDRPETRPVFEGKAAQTGSMILFAEDSQPSLWGDLAGIEGTMDLQGKYQVRNLRTVMTALDLLGIADSLSEDAIVHTALRMDFHGRWEKLSDAPLVICDIGHNSHALTNNFAQLEEMMASGRYDRLIVVYAVMADKDLDSIMPLMPECASWYFATPSTRRSLPSEKILEKYSAFRGSSEGLRAFGSVADTVSAALAAATSRSLVYIGGSTFAVSEAIPYFKTR